MTFPLFGLALFLIFVYFEPSIWFPFIANFRVAFVVAILTLLLTILKGGRIPKAHQNILFALLLIVATISEIFSPFKSDHEPLVMLFKVVVLYFLIIMITNSGDYIKKLFYIILTYASITSIFTLILSKFGYFLPGYENTYRLVSFFGGIGNGPNEFGALLLALFPLPIAMLEREKSLPKKILFIVIALSLILCITRTRSRGAFVGLLVILAIILWENRKNFGIILLITGLLVFTYFHTHHGYWERVATLKSKEAIEADDSARDRLLQNQYAIELMKLRPLTGIGMDNFVKAKIDLLRLDPESKITMHAPHNSYLGLGAEIGIFGMIVFILLIIISLLNCYSSEKFFKDRDDLFVFYKVSKGIRLGLIGFTVSIFFLSEQYNSILYQWIAFSVALKSLVRKEKGLLQ